MVTTTTREVVQTLICNAFLPLVLIMYVAFVYEICVMNTKRKTKVKLQNIQ